MDSLLVWSLDWFSSHVSDFELETMCGSTAFLTGPAHQIRMMLDPVHIYATAIYVGFVVLALICALWIHTSNHKRDLGAHLVPFELHSICSSGGF
ncbi:Vesicle transport protein like [Actinidia chinensis var. chinensis]|uniref:Vesicle transport protein n=1 Tax=Actinidia chinensis var. chinensis TaxID=1590841 RepID=A0A2R6RSQ6_ACTCC|nr:Vesicle transport protein like [Actinidia chinensis var. chinensis]